MACGRCLLTVCACSWLTAYFAAKAKQDWSHILLQDFVRLAKWEDRGYYAMKVTRERNQRQLHRLTRRAEQGLSEPAAAVLAATSKAMGFADLTQPEGPLSAPGAHSGDATGTKGGPGQGQGQLSRIPRAQAGVANTTKSSSSSLLSKSRKQALAKGSDAANEKDRASGSREGQIEHEAEEAWRLFCTVKVVAVPTSLEPWVDQAAALPGQQSSGYCQRLPQLVTRLQRMLLDAGPAWQGPNPGMLV